MTVSMLGVNSPLDVYQAVIWWYSLRARVGTMSGIPSLWLLPSIANWRILMFEVGALAEP